MEHLGLKHKFHILCFSEFQAEWVWEKVSKPVKELTTELTKTNCNDNCPAYTASFTESWLLVELMSWSGCGQVYPFGCPCRGAAGKKDIEISFHLSTQSHDKKLWAYSFPFPTQVRNCAFSCASLPFLHLPATLFSSILPSTYTKEPRIILMNTTTFSFTGESDIT